MIEFIQCVAMIIVHLAIFYGLGYILSVAMGETKISLQNMILGFFFYFLCMDMITVPMIMLKQSFSLVVVLWLAVLVICLGVLCWLRYKYRVKFLPFYQIKKGFSWEKLGIYAVIALIVLGLLYLVANQNYWGWDTSYYMGIVSTTLDSDTMFLIDGENGRMEKYIGFRYAFSSFYMNSAFWCRITGISVVFFQKYVMGSLCIILYSVLVCEIGRQLFRNDARKMCLFFCVTALLNLYFVTGYTSADFLLMRSYEAKSFCANVIFPALILWFLKLHEQLDSKKHWMYLMLTVWGSVPVSMSAILIAPVMVAVFVLSECAVTKNLKKNLYLCKNGVMCVVLNVVFLVMYFLFTKGIFMIRV